MNKTQMSLTPIGTILTPYESLDECPRNIGQNQDLCEIHVFDQFDRGLDGLQKGDEIQILYWLDQAHFTDLIRTSRKSGKRKGIFSLRTPHRPNPIGSAVVTIDSLTDTGLTVRGLDCLNGTALIDIKPAFKS